MAAAAKKVLKSASFSVGIEVIIIDKKL